MLAKRAYLISIGALTVAMGATGAHAQGMFSAPYVEFGGGLDLLTPTLTGIVSDTSTVLGPGLPSATLDQFGKGGGVYAAFGASVYPGLRLAVEAKAGKRTGSHFTVQAEGSGTVLVDTMTFAVMADIWKDFEISSNVSFHIGGGLGVGGVTADSTSGGVTTTSSTLGLAYMAGLGADFGLGNGMTLTVDYKLGGVGNGGLGTIPIDTSTAETVSGQLGTSLEHAVTIGLRIPLGG